MRLNHYLKAQNHAQINAGIVSNLSIENDKFLALVHRILFCKARDFHMQSFLIDCRGALSSSFMASISQSLNLCEHAKITLENLKCKNMHAVHALNIIGKRCSKIWTFANQRCPRRIWENILLICFAKIERQ